MAHRSLDILFVGTLPPHPGGAALSSAALLAGFVGQGHRVRALAPITEGARETEGGFAARCEVARFVVPRFETSSNLPPPDGYRELEVRGITGAFHRMIAEQRPDVVFIGRETFAWAVPDLARAYGLPSVLRFAGSLAGAILDGSYPAVAARRFMEQFRKVNLLVAPAEHLAERLARSGVANVLMIPNAIDLEQFRPREKDRAVQEELGLQPEHIVVAHVSNLQGIKRPLDLVESAERATGKDPRLAYVVIGDGAMRGAMEDACRRKGLAGRFRFVGWIDYDLVPRYLSVVDIVVMPSQSEVLARVYLETQACGRVLLASDIPAAREVIRHGETGLLFRLGDIDDLATKTVEAAAEPELRARIGRLARERVQAHGLDAAVLRYVAALESVVGRGRG